MSVFQLRRYVFFQSLSIFHSISSFSSGRFHTITSIRSWRVIIHSVPPNSSITIPIYCFFFLKVLSIVIAEACSGINIGFDTIDRTEKSVLF